MFLPTFFSFVFVVNTSVLDAETNVAEIHILMPIIRSLVGILTRANNILKNLWPGPLLSTRKKILNSFIVNYAKNNLLLSDSERLDVLRASLTRL